MRSNDTNFIFGPNFNFATENLLNTQNKQESTVFPPVSGEMDLLDHKHMLLLDGTDMLLL